MLRSRKYYAVLLVLLALVVALPFIRNRKKFVTNSGVVWTTEYHITYEARNDLNDSIQQVLTMIDKSASAFNKQSLVTAINEGKSDVADHLFKLMYAKALEINKASEGMYDPTVMPLVNAWGFGYKSGQLPTKEQIDSILAFIGIDHTKLNGNKVMKDDPRVQFDFSSIAKGLACDEVAAMLARNGATNYMVEIGGEVVAHGVNERGEPWHVSVDLPVPDNNNGAVHNNAMVLCLESLAVATSGSYRKFKELDGKKVSHIVNPKTGGSETSSLLSVSIVAKDCMSADAWATACMAMGLEKTQAMMEKNDTLGVMTISTDDDGNFVVWSNKRFADLIATTKNH
jgi:thiamine biosynthesis lipoprotein